MNKPSSDPVFALKRIGFRENYLRRFADMDMGVMTEEALAAAIFQQCRRKAAAEHGAP